MFLFCAFSVVQWCTEGVGGFLKLGSASSKCVNLHKHVSTSCTVTIRRIFSINKFSQSSDTNFVYANILVNQSEKLMSYSEGKVHLRTGYVGPEGE